MISFQRDNVDFLSRSGRIPSMERREEVNWSESYDFARQFPEENGILIYYSRTVQREVTDDDLQNLDRYLL